MTELLSGRAINTFDPIAVAASEGYSISDGLAREVRRIVATSYAKLPGGITEVAATSLVVQAAAAEDAAPLTKGVSFRYPMVSDIPELGSVRTAESNVNSAGANIGYMVARFGEGLFQAFPETRTRSEEYSAVLDDDYEIRVRGGSGASALSLDFGLGWRHPKTDYFGREITTYKELWRSGIDTEHHDGLMGVRVIRTGSGVKPGDYDKRDAFDEFRDRHGIMPQRLLAILNLYAARELEPDYVVALSTEGARALSTLGRSTGSCDYTGIAINSGLCETADPYWLGVGDYMSSGFYGVLDRADMNQREATALDLAVKAVNAAVPVRREVPLDLQICSSQDPEVVGQEIAAFLPNTSL